MEQKDYRLAAIMYTDIAGFSRMMEKDEAGTLELLKYHNDLIGGIAGRHHGTVIKTIGDALLLDFKNTVEALQSALEVEDQLYAHNKENPGLPLLVRIGVHLGDIYFFENDALGEGINIAARLQSLARPGCICFSQDVYNLVLNKIEFRAEKLGKVSLKNITKEIHAYEITTPNVEFDPNRDKPRPGYTPGSYLDEAEVEIPVGGVASSQMPASSRQAPPPPEPPRAAPESIAPKAAEPTKKAESARDKGLGGSNLLTEIRRAILADIKAMGRRMTVDEAREKYGFYGVEATEVIAAMADQGILARQAGGRSEPRAEAGDRPDSAGAPSSGFGIFGENIVIGGKIVGNTTDISKNIGAVVNGIVGEIERGVEQGRKNEASRYGGYAEKYARHAERYAHRAQRHAMRDAVRREVEGCETGKWDRKLMEDEEWKPGEEELAGDFEAYREGLATRDAKRRGGLVGNLVSFLGVNAFLWYINVRFSPSFFWAAFVSAAWGIGLVSSFVAVSRSGAKVREADAMPDLDSGQLAIYKKLNRMKDSMAQHAASTFTVPFLLGLINYMTSPSFLWFLIPTAALALGFLSHLAAYSASKPRLQRKLLDSLGVKGGWGKLFRGAKARRETASNLGPYAEAYREAEAARNAIAAQAASGAAGPVDSGLLPSLDQYLGQVRLLAQSANDIDRIVEAIPMTDLSKDKAALLAKAEAATSESLKGEYRASIAEIEKQERSYQELREQSEVVKLRLGSSVNQLKQMRLDIARVQASPGTEGAAGIESIRKRTDELARYLEDLRSGYDESKADPFAELEEAERKKLADSGDAPKGSDE